MVDEEVQEEQENVEMKATETENGDSLMTIWIR